MIGQSPPSEQPPPPAHPRGDAENPGSNPHRSADAEDRTQTFSPAYAHSHPHAESRFIAGQLIADRFTVIRFIAHGGMGEVYEVEDRLLRGARIALKVILPAIADDPASSRRFEQEVILARKINHPNLCPIYDIARSHTPPPPFLFLTMKLIAGGTLSERLKQPHPLSRDEKISIFRQMIAGIAAIHAGGIIHRDIKPNNVMLDHSGPEMCVVITDFGLARLHQPEETAATGSFIAGTPGYIAPEIFQGATPSQSTDLFALGVLLHHVFTGQPPLLSPRSAAVEPTPALDQADLPTPLKDAVHNFLSPDPQRRSNAFNLLHPSSGSLRLLNPEDLSAVPVVPAKTITRRQFAIGSAAFAGIAAGGITWKWDQFHDLLHPLPARRFVALVNWPASDTSVHPVLSGVIDAIGRELARAEAFDRDLLVLASDAAAPTTPAQLNEARESLGANLVLAASAVPARAGQLHLSLRVLDPSSSSALRARQLHVDVQHQDTLPEKAVRAAASLLGIRGYQPGPVGPGTTNAEAFVAFREAETLRSQENDTGLDQAIQKYTEAINLDPTYAVAQSRLAWAYLREYALKNNSAALHLAGLNCEAALRREPDLVDARLGLASFLQKTGDKRGADEQMARALQIDPTNPHTLTYQANFYAGENQWALAEQTFKRVFNLRPNYWLGHQELGVLYDVEGKYHEALVEFRAASLAAPRNALAVKNTGSVYLQLGQVQQAFESLQTSYAMKPDSATALAIAELFRVQHKYTEALDYAERAARMTPGTPDVWIELGDVHLSAGHRTQAEQAFSQAATYLDEDLRTSPNNGPGWMDLALCRAKTGQTEAALTLLARAEANHADDMDSQLLKVRILELAGRRDDALATLTRCLTRGPAQFQLQVMPDLEKLRTTAEYKSIVASSQSLA